MEALDGEEIPSIFDMRVNWLSLKIANEYKLNFAYLIVIALGWENSLNHVTPLFQHLST